MQAHTPYIRIGVRAMLIIGAIVLLAYAFLVRGDVAGSTFATGSGQGGLELKIDSKSTYNGAPQPAGTWALKDLVPGVDKFFNFSDIKPGDSGENTISLHVKKNPAWVCLDFVNLKDKDNGNNEPEALVDANGPLGGELSSVLEFFAWRDDGDNIFEIGEKPLFGTSTQAATTTLRGKTYAIADYTHGSPIPVNVTKYVGISWCAGDLKVSTTTATISCNGSAVNNSTQTDSMSIDVTFRAVQASDQPKFSCVVEKKPTCDAKDKDHKDKEDDKNKKNNSFNTFSKSQSLTSQRNTSKDDDHEDEDDECDEDDDEDDNHHNDDYHDEWHPVVKEHPVKKFVSYCKDKFNKFRV